jgi:hypothetical protein
VAQGILAARRPCILSVNHQLAPQGEPTERAPLSYAIPLTISSVIFLASPNSIMVRGK